MRSADLDCKVGGSKLGRNAEGAENRNAWQYSCHAANKRRLID